MDVAAACWVVIVVQVARLLIVVPEDNDLGGR